MPTSGVLDTITEMKAAFYRLVGLTSSDEGLTENAESTDDVFYLCLNRGFRAAQRWLIDNGHGHLWRKRSTALSWSGGDSTDGGRYASLPSDFLRLDGDGRKRSALIEAGGDQWGEEIKPDEDWWKGDYYYVRSSQLWLARTASPPSTLYLRYYYTHPTITSATVTFDMPMEARWLCVAEAADSGNREGWGIEGAVDRIEAAMVKAREEALGAAKMSRVPRRFNHPVTYGSHW